MKKLLSTLVLILAALPAWCAQVTISDTLRTAIGSNADVSSISISWPTFIKSDGHTVLAGSITVVPSSGQFSVALEASDTSSPEPTYTVVYATSQGNITQHWIVNTPNPVNTVLSVNEVAVSTLPASLPILALGQLSRAGGAPGDFIGFTSNGPTWLPAPNLTLPAAGLLKSTGTALADAAAADVETALGFTPQDSSAADTHNAGIGNCPAGEYMTGTAPGSTQPCSAQSGSGSGTVNSGTAGQFAYYSANGTAVGGHTLTAADIEGALTFTPQNSASANANNAGIGNCPSGEFMTGTAAGATQPCATPSGGGFTGTAGSVPFVGSGGTLTQDNANFFWDDTDVRLGIGTNTPAYGVDVFEHGLRVGYDSNSAWPDQGLQLWNKSSNHTWYVLGHTASDSLSFFDRGAAGAGLTITKSDANSNHNVYLAGNQNIDTGAGANVSILGSENGHIYTHGTAPTPSVCTLSFGNDHIGEAGMAATGNCTLTWATPYASSNYGVQLTVTPSNALTGFSKTASALTITTSAAATIDYDIVAVN